MPCGCVLLRYVSWCGVLCRVCGWGGTVGCGLLRCNVVPYAWWFALCFALLFFSFCVCVQFSWTEDFRTTAKTWFMSFGKSICEPIPLRYRTQRRFSSHQISRARWWIFNTEGTTCWLWLVLARPVVICVGQQGWLVVSNDLKSEGHQSTHGFGG